MKPYLEYYKNMAKNSWRKKSAFLVTLGLATLIACSLQESPKHCFYLEATPDIDLKLRGVMQRVAASNSLEYYDQSRQVSESGLYLEIRGAEVKVVTAHVTADPWICLYGNEASAEAQAAISAISSQLKSASIPYRFSTSPKDVESPAELWK